MSRESQDQLDQLLNDWADSREATREQTRALTARIVSEVVKLEHSDPPTTRGRFADQRAPASRPSRRHHHQDWGGKLMIGGGGLLLSLVLGGCILWYNLSHDPRDAKPGPSIASSAGVAPSVTTSPRGLPLDSFLGGAILTAKQKLLIETNAVFDDRLAWISDGEREVSLQVDDRDANESQFLLVRIVIAERTSARSDWTTVWQTDVIARNSSLVEIVPDRLGGSSLFLWTHLISDGEVAVEMDLTTPFASQQSIATNSVLRSGQPTRVTCSNDDGVERCVFQTVMPLQSS